MIGEIRTVDSSEVLSNDEKSIIASMCEDIKRKESLLAEYANNATNVRYQNAITNCGSEKEVASTAFNAGVVIDNSRFALGASNPEPAFKYFLGASYGPLSQLCSMAASSSPVPRVMTGSSDPVWVSAFSGKGGSCSSEEDTNCVYLETGIATSNSQRYRVRDVQFFAVNSDQESIERGFAREMSQITLCSNDESRSLRKMFLLGIQN